MNDLNHLVKAVRENLSREDRRLLRAVYCPPEPDRYDVVFERVLERLKSQRSAESNSQPPLS